MPEKWKDIEGFESRYQVSTAGSVRSLDRQVHNKGSGKTYIQKGRVMKLQRDKNGYLVVGLWNGEKPIQMKVHRLVALAFIEGRDAEVDHINGKRDDNRVENLRWATVSQNRSNTHNRKNASGATGVRFCAGKNKPWQAYCCFNGRFKSLGHFLLKQQATAARQEYMKEVFGD